MRPISIAFVLESLGSGGSERQVVELIRKLNAKRFRCRVLTYFHDDFFRAMVQAVGVPVVHVPRWGKFDLRPMVRLSRWMRTGEVDIAHAFAKAANLYAVLAARRAKVGYAIASQRSLMANESVLGRLYSPWVYRRASLVIANSDYGRSELIRRLALAPEKTLFVPNGLDFDRFKPASEEQRTRLRNQLGWGARESIALTAATYKQVKNHLGIIEALQGGWLSDTSLRLCWAGKMAPPDQFRRVVHRLHEAGCARQVQVLGERRDLVDLLRACDLLVLNSTAEGTPNVVLEALACGCPVIATAISDVPRYVIPGVTGWVVPPNDSTALRGALQEAAASPSGRLRAMGQAGRQHLLALRLDSATIATCHEALYTRLCSAAALLPPKGPPRCVCLLWTAVRTTHRSLAWIANR